MRFLVRIGLQLVIGMGFKYPCGYVGMGVMGVGVGRDDGTHSIDNPYPWVMAHPCILNAGRLI